MRLRKSILCVSLVGLTACLSWSNARQEGLRDQLAVVERERLWKSHGAYPELEQLDGRLGRLQSEQADLLARARWRCDRLFQEQAAHRLWNEQRSQLQGEVEHATLDFKVRTEREMKEVHTRFESQLKSAARLPAGDLQTMAAAAVTRFRLEKQKEMGQRIGARRQQLDEAVSNLEQDLQARYQDEKVNLQVRLEVREDGAARRRLAEIEQEIDTRVSDRRRLAETELSDYVTIEEGQLNLEVRDYASGLRAQLQPSMDVARLQSQERTQLAQLQKARQAELLTVVQNLEAAARDRFQSQLKGLKPKHHRAGEFLPEAFLSREERARLGKLPQEVMEVRRHRRELDQKMTVAIGRIVGQRAQGRAVLTDVRLNLGVDDLTDVSLAGVSELK